MFKKAILIFVLLVITISSSLTLSRAEEIINDEDIKIIQNDSIVPRKILFQSKEAISNINKQRSIPESLLSTSWDRTNFIDPLIFSRNLSIMLLLLFLIIQIVMTVIGKTSLKDLALGFITAIIMQFGLLIGLQMIIGITDIIGMFLNSIGKDYISEALTNMNQFSTSTPNLQPITKEGIGKLLSVDYAKSNLSLEGFCLNTIQDQYRVMSLFFNWVYLILVFANWVILLVSDFVLSIALILAPVIGISYMFGDRFQVINKYWSIVLQAGMVKIIFYLVFTLVVGLQNTFKTSLTQSGVNLEYAIFCCFILIALLGVVIKVSRMFKLDNSINGIITSINKLKSQ
jgi:hypothetical protein